MRALIVTGLIVAVIAGLVWIHDANAEWERTRVTQDQYLAHIEDGWEREIDRGWRMLRRKRTVAVILREAWRNLAQEPELP